MPNNDIAALIQEIDRSLAQYEREQRDPEITDEDFEKNREDIDYLLNRKAELRRQQIINTGSETEGLQDAIDEEMERLDVGEEPPESGPGDDFS